LTGERAAAIEGATVRLMHPAMPAAAAIDAAAMGVLRRKSRRSILLSSWSHLFTGKSSELKSKTQLYGSVPDGFLLRGLSIVDSYY
jgi:hypothetical protein